MKYKPPAIHERAVGFEMEYGFADRGNTDDMWTLNAGTIIDNLDVVAQSGPFYWLPNGAKVHEEINDLLEYASPETSLELVGANIRVAEEIIFGGIKRAIATQEHDPAEAALYLRVSDSGESLEESTTAGYHENYEADLSYMPPEIARFVMSQTLLSYCWAGAGKLVKNSQGQLVMSTIQKAEFPVLFDDLKKPYRTKAQRLEIRQAEYPLMPFAQKNKFSFMSGALRLAEQKVDLQQHTLASVDPESFYPTAITTTAAMDTRLTATYVMSDGSVKTALQHQQDIATDIIFYGAKLGFPDEEMRAAQAVAELTAQIEVNPDKGYRHVGFLSKLRILEGSVVKNRVDLSNHNRLLQLEIGHDILGRNGYVNHIRKRDRTNSPDIKTIEACMSSPPSRRAFSRTSIMRRLIDQGYDLTEINWDRVMGHHKHEYGEKRVHYYTNGRNVLDDELSAVHLYGDSTIDAAKDSR